MLLSICIPNYKKEECLNNCLNSIYIVKKILIYYLRFVFQAIIQVLKQKKLSINFKKKLSSLFLIKKAQLTSAIKFGN
jgi:hypothetical protein